jgi:hypothetical protein
MKGFDVVAMLVTHSKNNRSTERKLHTHTQCEIDTKCIGL